MLIGIVGKPSVGKSTFFKASTLAEVEIASYPFTTIKPNRAVGYVKIKDPAKDFGKTSNPRNGFVLGDYRFVAVELLDVAGLVPGAHEGKGLGNQFLNDLSQADVLIHVVDISGSTNEKGEAVKPLSYDPCNDLKFLEKELDMWILQMVKKGWDKFIKQNSSADLELHKAMAKQLSSLRLTEDDAELILKNFDKNVKSWDEIVLFHFAKEVRKKTKPIIIAANKIDVKGAEANLENIKREFPDYTIVPCSADSELALREASKRGLISYIPGDNNFIINKGLNDLQLNALNTIKENVLNKFGTAGVQDVLNVAVFELLKYLAIFPGGVNKLEDSQGRVLPDCFLMKKGSTALDFAYKLHTDFGKNFIRAINVRRKLTVGKDYELNNLDILEIIANR